MEKKYNQLLSKAEVMNRLKDLEKELEMIGDKLHKATENCVKEHQEEIIKAITYVDEKVSRLQNEKKVIAHVAV